MYSLSAFVLSINYYLVKSYHQPLAARKAMALSTEP